MEYEFEYETETHHFWPQFRGQEVELEVKFNVLDHEKDTGYKTLEIADAHIDGEEVFFNDADYAEQMYMVEKTVAQSGIWIDKFDYYKPLTAKLTGEK